MRDFLHSTRVVILGMAVAQVIPILGSLLIARIYAPEVFGEFSAWLGLMLLVAVMCTGRFEMSLPVLSDGIERREGVLSTVVVTLIASSALFIVGLAVFFVSPASLPKIDITLLILFAPAALVTAVLQIWQNWAAANGDYRALSGMRIAVAFSVTISQVVVGYFFATSVALAGAYLFGSLIGLIISVRLLSLKIQIKDLNHRFSQRFRHFLREQRNFPKFALPADAISTASSQLPLILIAAKFGAEASGLYALTIRVLGAPIGFLGKAVLDVFKRVAAQEFNQTGSCRKVYKQTFAILTLLGIALIIVVTLVGEYAFSFLFGEAWRYSGTIAIWLAPLFALRFVASPLSYVFYVAGKQHIDLLWQSALFIITVSSFSLIGHFQTSIYTYVSGYCFLYVVYLLLSYRYSKA